MPRIARVVGRRIAADSVCRNKAIAYLFLTNITFCGNQSPMGNSYNKGTSRLTRSNSKPPISV
ncbi:hypothetical protein SPLC1_S150020 [Arthrospira platensis C1]|nr:hypothetical protein SPLC1_S150020 [Arthrospira platensis C1]